MAGKPVKRKIIKVTGYTLQGSNSAIFIFTSLLKGSQFSNGRICSLSNLFSLRLEDILDGHFVHMLR